MAKRKTLIDLLDELEDSVATAFMDSIALIKSDAQIGLIVEAIKARDTEAVVRLLRMDGAYFETLDDALRAAYSAGGAFAVDDMLRQARAQGAKVSHRFDTTNPRAQAWVQSQSSRLIVEISDGTRALVRETLSNAFTERRSPRTTALDLVGRVNKATGKREGGIIGLTAREQGYVDTALTELRSGDRAMLENYLSRKTRDKRFDPSVMRAIREGQPIPADKARKMVIGMEKKLLRIRGERIARTELLPSLHAAGDEAMQQLIDRGEIGADAVTNTWDAAGDSATRDSHRAMDSQTRQHGEAFISGDGNLLRYPGDRSLGAPASDTINCRCVLRRNIDFISTLRRGE